MPPCSCGKHHHKLLCYSNKNNKKGELREDNDATKPKEVVETYLTGTGTMAVFPICKASFKEDSRQVTILLDGGSNASYVTTACAQRHKLKKLEKVTLTVTTVGGKDKSYKSSIYEANLRTTEGKIVTVTMYELPQITGKVSPLNREVVAELFPEFDPKVLSRDGTNVDLLLGTDYFGLHPKEELANAGANLSVMRGKLGVCLVGTHPRMKEATEFYQGMPKTLHASEFVKLSFIFELVGFNLK